MPVGCHWVSGMDKSTSRLAVYPRAFYHPVEEIFMMHSPHFSPVGHNEPALKDPLIPEHFAPVPINALHLKRAYRRSQGNME
jgi:hypothetical protein